MDTNVAAILADLEARCEGKLKLISGVLEQLQQDMADLKELRRIVSYDQSSNISLHQPIKSDRDVIRNFAAKAGSIGATAEDFEKLFSNRSRASIRSDLFNLVKLGEFSKVGERYVWQCSPEDRPKARRFSRRTIKIEE